MPIREFRRSDTEAVVALWERCDLTRPWNDPYADIDRKMADSPWGLLVECDADRIIGTVMVGYDGHRGWVNYLACEPSHQRQGIASALIERAIELLRARGCPKLNLQIRDGNDAAASFYAALGFAPDAATSMGLPLVDDG